MKRLQHKATATGKVAAVLAAVLFAGCSAGTEPQPASPSEPATELPEITIEPTASNESQTEPRKNYVLTKDIGGVAHVSIRSALSERSYQILEQDASTMDPSVREEYGRLILGEWLDAFSGKYNVSVHERKIYPRYGYMKAFIPKADFIRLVAAGQNPEVVIDGANFAKHDDLLAKTVTVSTEVPATLAAKLSGDQWAEFSQMRAVIAAERAIYAAPSHSGLKKVAGHVAKGDEGFSGLKSIKVKEFEDAVLRRVSAIPTGERVTVGVVDTGISYGHLGYTGTDGKTTRIRRMGEFTGEGRVFFNPSSPITVEAPAAGSGATDDMLVVGFQYYAPRIGSAPPAADDMQPAVKVTIKPSAALAKALKAANSPARVGIFSEKPYEVRLPDGSLREGLDINQNGKTNDDFLVILVPSKNEAGADTSTLYMALTRPKLGKVPAHYDFTPLAGVRNFNTSFGYIDLLAARFGFQIQDQVIADKAGNPVKVHTASMVGVDPGLHGSHVAGIIGARKTFINDSNQTKARGVAPLTQLQMNRVCANRGGCFNMDQAWMDLAKGGADIINVSIGGLPPINDGYTPAQYLVNRMTQKDNVLFAISAGNSGSGYNTTGSPSNAMLAVSVAATATPAMVQAQRQLPGTGNGRKIDQDFVLYFSSRGPTGAGGFKPDIAAPGTEISIFPGANNPVESSGSGWMHGTSMSSPTFAGAAALFLDAVRLYNEKNPNAKLPSDALTLRQVLTGSARPFGLASGPKKTPGDGYSWIDQGSGMVDLQSAWKAIFALRDSKIPSPVWGNGSNGKKQLIDLIYEAKIIHTGPNGKEYKGGAYKEFARGLWLDYKSQGKVYAVNISRNLSKAYEGELSNPMRTLTASMDRFVLKTRMDGVAKDIPWLKVGTLNQTACEKSETKSSITIKGKGMVDGKKKNDPVNSFYVCVNRSEVAKLPAGEHGAVIELYKTSVDGSKVEALPSLRVPVFLAVPEQKLANKTGYALKGAVAGYLSTKRYIDVPKGVTAVAVTISVPEAKVTAKNTQGCSYIFTNIYEADNKSAVPELAARDWVRNCTDKGAPEANASLRTITYTRNNPKPGIWVFDLTGHGTVLESAFEMNVEYAAVKADVAKLEKLSGSFAFDYELSTKSKPDAKKSLYAMLGMEQVQRLGITKDPSKQIAVPTKGGVINRVFDNEKIKKVVYSTGNTLAPDVDLGLLSCAPGITDISKCAVVKQSTSSASDEKVVLLGSEIQKGYTYVPIVVGYNVNGTQEFDFTEQYYLVDEEAIDPVKDANELGILALIGDGDRYKVIYTFSAEKAAKSRVLTDPMVKSGDFTAMGTLKIAAEDGFQLLTLPVILPAPSFFGDEDVGIADEDVGIAGELGQLD